MRRILCSVVAVAAVCAYLCSCTGHDDPVAPAARPQTGTVEVTIHAGGIGALSKAAGGAAIEMSDLYVALSAEGEKTVYDTLPLTGGSHERTERKTYTGLASRIEDRIVDWTLTVESRDGNGEVIHSGDTTFAIPPLDTAEVELRLSAQYSMLKANYRPIRDSVTRCELVVDGEAVADSSFAKQSLVRENVQLAFDYLQASPMGASNDIVLNVYGVLWGIDTLLYTGDTTIAVVSGQDTTYDVVLDYVGPDTLHGAANMVVTLGAVGTTTINGSLAQPQYGCPTFSKLCPADNLAMNTSGSGYPSPLSSDDGWGGGTSKWDIVDGQRCYNSWARGLAFTGGERPYVEPCGWRQATIDFGQDVTFDRVAIWHHGGSHIPNTYKLEYWDGSQWVELFSTTSGSDYLIADTDCSPWSEVDDCSSGSLPTENTFPEVTGSKVRYQVHNCDIGHGWIYSFEVYND